MTEPTSRSSAQEIDTRFSLDCKNTNLFVERLEKDKDTDKNVDADRDRTGRPVVIGQPTGSSTPFDEVNMDFRIPGLPHAILKQVESSRVRELVKKIENLFKTIYNKIMLTTHLVKISKKMIKDMGNVESFELFETDPETQCKKCLLY